MSCQDRLFTGIASSRIDSVWCDFEDILQRTLLHGDYKLENIRQLCENGQMQLWVAYYNGLPEAASVTQIIEHPQQTVCEIVLMAGKNIRALLPYLKIIEQWAYSKGARVLRIQGRKGWNKMLIEYKQIAIVMERQLCPLAVKQIK